MVLWGDWRFFTCPVPNTLAEADSHALAYSCGDKAFKTSLYTGASSLLWLIVVVYYMSRNKRFRVVVNHDTHDNHGNRQGTPEVSWWHVRHQLQLHHHGGLASASYALTLGRALIISIAGLAILMLGPFYWWLAPSDYECQFLSRPSLGLKTRGDVALNCVVSATIAVALVFVAAWGSVAIYRRDEGAEAEHEWGELVAIAARRRNSGVMEWDPVSQTARKVVFFCATFFGLVMGNVAYVLVFVGWNGEEVALGWKQWTTGLYVVSNSVLVIQVSRGVRRMISPEAPEYTSDRSRRRRATVGTFVTILSFIIVPVAVVVLADPRCMFYAWHKYPFLSTEVEIRICDLPPSYDNDDNTTGTDPTWNHCDEYSVTSKFRPEFEYNGEECTTAVLEIYIPVLCASTLLISVLVPTARLVLPFIRRRRYATSAHWSPERAASDIMEAAILQILTTLAQMLTFGLASPLFAFVAAVGAGVSHWVDLRQLQELQDARVGGADDRLFVTMRAVPLGGVILVVAATLAFWSFMCTGALAMDVVAWCSLLPVFVLVTLLCAKRRHPLRFRCGKRDRTGSSLSMANTRLPCSQDSPLHTGAPQCRGSAEVKRVSSVNSDVPPAAPNSSPVTDDTKNPLGEEIDGVEESKYDDRTTLSPPAHDQDIDQMAPEDAWRRKILLAEAPPTLPQSSERAGRVDEEGAEEDAEEDAKTQPERSAAITQLPPKGGGGTLRVLGTLGFVDDSEDRHSVEQLPTGVCVGKTIKSPAGEIRYHVGRLLGEGNFGRVFEGIPASQSQKQAALKVFKNTEKKAEACEEALHHLNLGAHPHRVTLYEVLLIELNKAEKATRTQPAGGELLVAMELAGGELQRLIYGGSDRRGDRGPLFDLPEGEVQATALRFASQLAAALAAMHNGENSRNNEKRYLHCDVKPENALVSGQNLKLIDFGGASAFVANSSERQGFVWSTVSTVSHASPELIKLRERLRTSRRAAAREAYVNLQLSVRLREQAKFAWNGQVGKFDRPQLLNKKPDQASDIWKQLNEDAIPTVNRAMLEAKQRFLYSELVTPQITDVWAWAVTVLQLHTGEKHQNHIDVQCLFSEYINFDQLVHLGALRWTGAELVEHLATLPGITATLMKKGKVDSDAKIAREISQEGVTLRAVLIELPSIREMRSRGALSSVKELRSVILEESGVSFKIAQLAIFLQSCATFKALLNWYAMPSPLLECLKLCFGDAPGRPTMDQCLSACRAAAVWLDMQSPLVNEVAPSSEEPQEKQVIDSLITIGNVLASSRRTRVAAKEALESVIARDPNHARAAKKLRDLSKTMAHEGDSGKEDAEAVEELAEAVEELIDDEAKVDELIKQSQRVSYNRERRTTLVDGRHTTLFEEPDEADEENVYEPGFVMKDLYPLSEEIAVAEVVKFAAQGKFGTIYEVKPMPRQNTSASAGHERWAAKCARLHVVNDPAAKKQIQKDLWASAKLSFVLGAHEHLTPVRNALCMGPAFSNVHSVVVFTDFIEGSNVQTLIDNGDLYDGTPSQSLGRILGLVVQLFDGLYHVHRKSVIHQDIKADNLMVTTDGVLKIVDFDLAAIGRTEWRENPWHRRPSQQSSDEDLELRACKLALENGWSKTESNDELAVDKEMGELRDLVKDLVDAQYKAKQGRVACLVSFDSAVRKAQNACSEFCLVRDKPSRQFPQVVELCEIEHTLNRQVEDVLDERYELDLYASLTGVTQMMQSAEVKELHSKLEDTRSLRTHEELKHKFSVTPRVTDLWSAGLVVLQMFEGSGLVRGFPPWACQRNDILPSGGERAHEELTRFLSKYRKSSEDVRSWDIEEVVDWVSLCDELNDEDTHLVDLVRTCRVPGADLVDLADQSIRVIKTRLPGISAPSAKRLKRAIKSNFATIDMPMLLQELLADMFGRVPTDRPKTEICLARLEELRAKYHATETPVRHITYDNIAFTLRNLGRAFEHEKDGQAAVEAYASWLVKAKNNAEHHEEAIDGILRVLRNREMNVRVIDLSQANHQHLTRDEFDRICCALVDGNGVGEFNIEGVGITGRIPGILAKAKRLGKLCFARNSFEGRLPIRLACRFWLNSDMLQIEGNPKLGGLLTNHFPLTLSGVLGGMSICVLFTLECLIVIFFLVEAALQEHQFLAGECANDDDGGPASPSGDLSEGEPDDDEQHADDMGGDAEDDWERGGGTLTNLDGPTLIRLISPAVIVQSISAFFTMLAAFQSIVKRWRLSRLVFIGNVRRERFPGAAPAMVLDFAMWCTTMSMLFIALYFDDKRLKKGPTIFLAGLFWVLTLIALCVASLSRHDPVFLKNLGDKLEFRFWVNVLVPASLFQLFCVSAFLLMVPLAVLQTVMSHHVQLKWALLPLPVLMPVPYALCWFRLRLKLYTIPVFATLASILTWLIYLSLAGFWCSASSWPLVLIPVYVVLAWMLTTVVVVLWTLITRFQRIVPGAAYLLRRWRA